MSRASFNEAHCAFCGKNSHEVTVLIAAPVVGTYICEECVEVCCGLVTAHAAGVVDILDMGVTELSADTLQ